MCSIRFQYWTGAAEAMPIQYLDPAPEPEAGSNKCHEPMQLAIQGPSDDEDDMCEKDLTDTEQVEDIEAAYSHHSHSHAYVPASFFAREVYCKLKDEGLTILPFSDGQGFALRCHSKSKQWHGVWEARKRNFAPTFGNKRSETMSLLCVWTWYLSIADHDEAGKDQLNRIQEKIKTVEF